MNTTDKRPVPFWSLTTQELYERRNTSIQGLTTAEAEVRRRLSGLNTLKKDKKKSGILLFLNQFKSPITLLLLLAAILSFFLGGKTDATIIIIIVLFSVLLGYRQERTAGNAVAQLLSLIQVKTSVIRDGQKMELLVEDVVPGDCVTLGAGDIVPADCLLVEESELFVDEAAFTGETFPVEKKCTVLPEKTELSKRVNSVFMGSHIVSGTAKAIVVNTGASTEFGLISHNLKKRAPETAFQVGIRKFGYLLMQITLVMVVFLFGVNVMLEKPILDSLLFTLAIAIGLTPQLLPAIITVNLSQGAKRMAEQKVIVKRLDAIENFGNMDVLCSDKTGTLTTGKVTVCQGLNCFGKENEALLLMAKINATLQQGFKNPIDNALAEIPLSGTANYTRVDEIPYDFIRKRLSILAKDDRETKLIAKGAVKQILEVCTQTANQEGVLVPIQEILPSIRKLYEELSSQGYRTLGVAYKLYDGKEIIHKTDETDMIFAGFITLFDSLKEGITETIKELQAYGVELKIITGDNALIAKNISKQIGFKKGLVLSGAEMRKMSDAALTSRVVDTCVFAEIDPNQKERIILALKKAGKTVGYMGDGINDVSAIHAADVGLSVNTAVDVAKEAADLVILEQDLNVLTAGIKEGRRTFANTRKYIFMATSANFGNMFSMAGASFLLPFLPLLPKQILLANLLTDFPSMTISTDNVDEDWIKKPGKWDIKFIKRFMISFGLLSSVFDYITFGVLLLLFNAKESEFQTGWFIESVVSATLIVLVVRTQKTFLKSKPGNYLTIASLLVAITILILPELPVGSLLGFTPLPLSFYLVMLSIVAAYILSAEWMKKWFYRQGKTTSDL